MWHLRCLWLYHVHICVGKTFEVKYLTAYYITPSYACLGSFLDHLLLLWGEVWPADMKVLIFKQPESSMTQNRRDASSSFFPVKCRWWMGRRCRKRKGIIRGTRETIQSLWPTKGVGDVSRKRTLTLLSYLVTAIKEYLFHQRDQGYQDHTKCHSNQGCWGQEWKKNLHIIVNV